MMDNVVLYVLLGLLAIEFAPMCLYYVRELRREQGIEEVFQQLMMATDRLSRIVDSWGPIVSFWAAEKQRIEEERAFASGGDDKLL